MKREKLACVFAWLVVIRAQPCGRRNPTFPHFLWFQLQTQPACTPASPTRFFDTDNFCYSGLVDEAKETPDNQMRHSNGGGSALILNDLSLDRLVVQASGICISMQ